MQIDYVRLINGGRLEWTPDEDDVRSADETLRIVVGRGRGCVMRCTTPSVAILIPLRGRLQISEGESAYALEPRDLLVVEPGQRLQAIGRGSALWVALLADAQVWRRLTGEAAAGPEPLLLPALSTADRSICRAVVRLARLARDGSGDEVGTLAAGAVFAMLMTELQSEFDPLIDRCPGRTLGQRRSVFLRLQRVRNLMASSCHLDLDIAGFARMASYSPCHFIRAFSAVYGQTPHAVLTEQRLNRAHRLINGSSLAIAEVARVSGFENRCAFSRSFKRRFGITASDLREGARQPDLAA